MNGASAHACRTRLLLAAVAAMLIAQAPAAEHPDPSEDLPLGRRSATIAPAAATAQSSAPWLWQTLAALAVVIGLILALRLLLQRMPGGRTIGAGEGPVEVVARSNIAPRTQLLFLRINQRIIIAAQTAQGLSTLAILDQPQDVAWVLDQAQRGGTRGFRQVLHRFEAAHHAAEADPARAKLTGLLAQIRAVRSKEVGR
jgi:flagellar biogenesis protein FliO